MNLATQRSDEPANIKTPKESYPSFSINDKHVDEFLKQHKLGMGDEIYATVCLKVTHMSADNYGKRIGFDVKEISDIEPEAEGAKEKTQDEELETVQKGISDYEA